MSNNRSWCFEETCPECDRAHIYHFSEVDEHGFVTCKYCDHKMHACCLCDNHDRCNDCDIQDASKSNWHSEEMAEYLRYRLNLAAEKQDVFSQYLKAQGDIIKALYDDDVDAETFMSILNKQLAPELELKPKFVEDTIYIDKAGSAWFRHRGFDFHILKLVRFGTAEGDMDTGKLTVACEPDVYRQQLNTQGKIVTGLLKSFYLIPDCWCDAFDVTADDAWEHVAKWLLPEINSWIDEKTKTIN